MKVSDYICKNLRRLTGSKNVFLLSGGGMMHLLDSLGKCNLNPVSMHHEPVSYTTLTLPTTPTVYLSVVAITLTIKT